MSQLLGAIELHSVDTSTGPTNTQFAAEAAKGPDLHHASTNAENFTEGASHHRASDPMQIYPRKSRIVIIIAQLATIPLLASLSNGLLTVGLPRMAVDLDLAQHLIFWPLAVNSLTTGSCLLLAGSIADVVGSRLINLTGCLLVGLFVLACGLARTGIELIIFRAMQGVAVSLTLPTSVAILTNAVPNGRGRNVGFACLGLVQPLGFSVGLVLGGIFLDSVGWRFGYYFCGVSTIVLFCVGIWALPQDRLSESPSLRRLRIEIDWIGAAIASTCLATFSYVLASLTTSTAYIHHSSNIALLSASLALVPTFIFWVGRQERLQRPALIPNSIWMNAAFTSTCLMVMLSYAVMQTLELFSSLFFQQIQHLSALQTSIRILPSLILGTVLNFTTGLLVHRVPAIQLVLISSFLCAGSPLLMALIDPRWPYWYDGFWAQLLSPLSGDVLFTVGILIVSDGFPDRTQALAGAVFNTVAQFGTSIGLAIIAVISTSVTQHSKDSNKSSPAALLAGYRASFWAAFAGMIISCCIGAFGLRKVGKVGLKRD